MANWTLFARRHKNGVDCAACSQRLISRVGVECEDLFEELSHEHVETWLNDQQVLCVVHETEHKHQQEQQADAVSLSQEVDDLPLLPCDQPSTPLPRIQRQARSSSPSRVSNRGSINEDGQHEKNDRFSPRRNPPSIILTRIQDEKLLEGDPTNLERVWSGWCEGVFDDNIPPKMDFKNIDRIVQRGKAALEISFCERPKLKLVKRFVDGMRGDETCCAFVYDPDYTSPKRRAQYRGSPFANDRVRDKTAPRDSFYNARERETRRHSFRTPPDSHRKRLDFVSEDRGPRRREPFSLRRLIPYEQHRHSPQGFVERRYADRLHQVESKLDYLLTLIERVF